jgi:predicted ATPase
MISRQYLLSAKLRREKVDSFDSYPFSLPAVKHMESLEFHPNVTFFVGENGSGKSTLIEALAVAFRFNPEGGSRNFRFGTRRSHSGLHEFVQLIKGAATPRDGFFFRAESFFNVATEIDALDAEPGPGRQIRLSYGPRALHEQSHGESFLALLNHRFGGEGLYLLDEPEAALSPQRQFAVISRMHDLVLRKSQFIIATHSPILLAYPNSWIYEVGENGLRRIEYRQTEHYRLTKMFVDDPDGMLRRLMA